jgi:hypothetical protein
MYDMTTREQQATLTTLRREVEQQLARSGESMQYTHEQARGALDAISGINLTTEGKVLATDYITIVMLKGAMSHGGLLPGTQETILELNQQFHQFAGQTHALACQAVLQDLYCALAEGVPEEETNPIIRLLQGR